MMTKIDRTAVIASVLYLVCTGGRTLLASLMLNAKQHESWIPWYYLLSIPHTLLVIVFNVAVAWWLFKEARTHKRNPYIWAAMGLFFQLSAVLIFMILPAYETWRQERANQAPEGTAR